LLIGLAKVILLEQDPQDVFRRMGISNVPELAEGEEFEFNLSSVKLSLRKVKLENFREVAREEVWSTTAWGTIKILFQGFNIDGSFEDLLDDVARKLTNARSKNRIAGIFKSMVSVKSGEVGTAKGKGKEDALEKVAQTLAEALDDGSEVVALYAGGFKPPHLAHFENAKFLSTKADKIVIFIGPKIREGVKITAEQSKAIWEIYAKYINVPMEIVISKVTPVLDTYEWIDANQDKVTNIITGAMADEMKKFAGIEKKKQNGEYKNVEVKELPVITNKEDDKFSATDIRKSEKFLREGKWIPKVVSKEDKQAIVDLIAPQQEDSIEDKMLTAVDTVFESFFPKKDTKEVVKEGSSGTPIQPSGAIPSKDREDLIELFNQLRSTIDSDKYTVVFEQDRIGVYIKTYADVSFDQTPLQKRLPEGAEQEKFNYTPYIASILEYMIDQGINITPLPDIKVREDEEEASDFFGKTAYYRPDSMEVVLYTLGRHPKDVCRSFAHEMIHHIQNLEGRIGGGRINTSNVNEDEYLKEIEKEAYLRGNILFREWSDNYKVREENKKVMAEGKYDKLSNMVSSDIFRAWKEAIDSGEDGVQFKKKYQALGGEFDVEATLELMFETNKMEVLDTTGAGTDKLGDFIRIDIDIDEEMLPQGWEEISMTLKDIVRHEIEHLTHNIGSSTSNPNKGMEDDLEKRDWIKARKSRRNQYFHLDKEVDANLQGLLFRAKKERKPFADVVNTYLDAQQLGPRQREKILNIWRKRLPALGIKQTL
jgi:nicotinamide mononucleotide adenylyltransferase